MNWASNGIKLVQEKKILMRKSENSLYFLGSCYHQDLSSLLVLSRHVDLNIFNTVMFMSYLPYYFIKGHLKAPIILMTGVIAFKL